MGRMRKRVKWRLSVRTALTRPGRIPLLAPKGYASFSSRSIDLNLNPRSVAVLVISSRLQAASPSPFGEIRSGCGMEEEEAETEATAWADPLPSTNCIGSILFDVGYDRGGGIMGNDRVGCARIVCDGGDV
ncbi:hypothetical protein MUK42_00209 [Musa troglodytarum]|uniref:Uncharacterized protein n=1 Tax=Musa troglodytarum TaxID=320322 RepID=A0A9E7FBE6_9LILI|nr:hypothetical protein MUK42_00209 [Musa troglodytarum]